MKLFDCKLSSKRNLENDLKMKSLVPRVVGKSKHERGVSNLLAPSALPERKMARKKQPHPMKRPLPTAATSKQLLQQVQVFHPPPHLLKMRSALPAMKQTNQSLNRVWYAANVTPKRSDLGLYPTRILHIIMYSSTS